MPKDSRNSSPGMKLTKRLAWRLPVLMAEHGVRTATELKRRLQDIGYEITTVHAARIVHDRPLRINSELLDALVTIFDCTANEILAVREVDPEEGDIEMEARKSAEFSQRVGKERKTGLGKKKPKSTRANLPEGVSLEDFTGPKLHAIPNPYRRKDD